MDNNDGSLRPGPLPDGTADADLEWAQYVAWLDREAAAGRVPEPELWAPDDEEPWDPEPDDPDLAGPTPAGPELPLFAEDGAADLMPPGPFLAALTERAVGDVACLSDAELVGVLRASQRLVAREQYKQVLAAAEFGRRRQATFEDALRRGVPAGCAPGGFPGEELAMELTVSRAEAGHLIDDAIDLTSRLPQTLAAMAAGLIDAGRAGWIALYTRSLDPADVARADAVLAEAAPELRVEQLARKAAALEMKLNPEGVKARRERARQDGQRVEARREASGNASLAGRELDVGDVLASKAYLDAMAARLRDSGLAGTLDRLRALALTDLTQGRNPLDRITPTPVPAPPAGPSPDCPPAYARAGDPAPVPALINLLVPATTLLGLSAAPAQAGSWGLLDAGDTRTVVTAAAAHPATRWCLTLTVIFSSGVSRGRDLRHRGVGELRNAKRMQVTAAGRLRGLAFEHRVDRVDLVHRVGRLDLVHRLRGVGSVDRLGCPGASRAAVIGTGVQASAHARALARLPGHPTSFCLISGCPARMGSRRPG